MKKLLLLLPALFALEGASAQFDHQNISLLGTFDDSTVVPEPVYGIRYQSCWGWTDQSSGREYGIIGSTAGTYIVEVTNPSIPVERAYIPGQSNNRIWHEYKTYGNYLYIISDGGGNTLQIVDLSYLPDSVHKVYDATAIFDSGHTLYVDGQRLYVASVSRIGGNYSSLNVYNLANPELPVLLRRLDQDFPAISQVHDIYVVNDTVYASCAYQGLFIYRYDEGTNRFTQLGSLTTYPDAGYNHSSFLSQDHSTLYMCDEVPDGLAVKVVDVTDIFNPTVVDTFYTNAGATPHNPYVKGNYLYLAAYQDGIYVYDISQPTVPVRSGYFDTHPQNPPGTYPNPPYAGCWAAYTDLPSGILLASDMQLGLFVLDPSLATGIPSGVSKNSGVLCYPNPASSTLSFRLNGAANERADIVLTDLQGRIVLQTAGNTSFSGSISADVHSLPAGLYLAHLSTPATQFTRRIEIIR